MFIATEAAPGGTGCMTGFPMGRELEPIGISESVACMYLTGSRHGEICELGRTAATGDPIGPFITCVGFAVRLPETAIAAGFASAEWTTTPAADANAKIVASQFVRTTRSPYESRE
jgi:hypothetical protein